MTKEYDYFLSYAGDDVQGARTLHGLLAETSKVFFAGDIPKGADWESLLRRALSNTQNVLVLLTESSRKATYQRAEVEFALRAAETDDSMLITPICVGVSHEHLPLGLNLKQAITISSWTELPAVVETLAPRPPQINGSTPGRLGQLVNELERALVEKHNAPRTIAWGAEAHGTSPSTGRAARIAELSSQITAAFQPRAGAVIADAKLLKVIGRGSFADVWEGERSTGERVAVKVFHVALLQKDIMLWRFRRGAEALSRLGERKRRKQAGMEPGSVMEVLDMDESTLAFAMPLMGFGSLDGIATFKWSVERKIQAFDRICSAVAYAHGQNIVHRDIKPGNVMINDSYEPVLSDFDIADIGMATQFSTAIGGLGTPVFAAPEQLRSATEATERSDVFSLGRLLHFMLIERSPGPFTGEADLVNLRSLPASLVEIVRKCIQREPTDRLGSVEELRKALREHQTRIARLKAGALRILRFTARHSIALSVVGAAAIAMGIVAIIGAQAWSDSVKRGHELENLFARYEDLEKRQAGVNDQHFKMLAQSRDLREQITAKESELQEMKNSLGYSQTDADRKYKATKIDLLKQELGVLRNEFDQNDAKLEAERRELGSFLEEQRQERAKIELARAKKPSSFYQTWSKILLNKNGD